MSKSTQSVRSRLRTIGVLATVAILACATGCVQRRMTIRSNPPGALVYVDNREIGITPASVSFIYYGTRQIRLVKDGYETLVVQQPVLPPWYQIPPLDFFSENIVPGELRDQRTFTYQMRPQMVVPTDQLIQRGEGLRSAAQAPGGVMNAGIVPLADTRPVAGPDGALPGTPAYPPAFPAGSGGAPVQPVAPYGGGR